jgi:sulfhydrogenase subunit beta (sulfur reductase)
MKTLDLKGLNHLLLLLEKRGYGLVGPVIKDGAIIYGPIHSLKDLPSGWTDSQEGGSYRLLPRNDEALFGYSVGPQSLKNFLFPPLLKIWSARKNGKNCRITEEIPRPSHLAIIGVRSCDLQGLLIQDKVFLNPGERGGVEDSYYRSQRENLFFIAVNCAQAGKTCFCHSMGTGPEVQTGYDLVMTEILQEGLHEFILDAGSERGKEILEKLPGGPAGEKEKRAVQKIISKTVTEMIRSVNTAGIQTLFYENQDHPRWEETALRCLACGNCTMVCPTCFCSTVEDSLDLTGTESERIRKWDSCFSPDFSYIHGGAIRTTVRTKYRQWLTHKLAGWIEQFGSSGCVGCGRCITWCPPGIDLTEEVKALRAEGFRSS